MRNSGVAVPGSEAPSQMRKRSVAVGESYEAAELDDQKAVVDERLESQSAPEAAAYRFSVIICSRTVISPLNLV